MSKIERVPLYEERIVCGNCGFSLPERYTPYVSSHFKFNLKCCVCGKEACEDCSTWFTLDGVKYLFHEKCRKNLPKDILEKRRIINEEWDRREEEHQRNYPVDHII